MKRFYTFAFTLALLLTGALSANAQKEFSGSLTQAYQRDWANDRVVFSLEEIASYFETDVTTLSTSLQAFIAADSETFKTDDNSDKELYFTSTPIPDEIYPCARQSYSASNNGFWMDDRGIPLAYGAEGYSWYAFPDVDDATGEFAICVGQLPNHFDDGANLETTLVLHYKGKEASFNVKVTVEPKPTVDFETNLSKLTIVKDYEFPLEFTSGKYYEGKSASITLEGVYDLLGTTADELDADATYHLFTQMLIGEDVEGTTLYSWSDELKMVSEASGGSWFGRYYEYDESTGNETLIEMNAPKEWSESADNQNTYYLQDITLSDGEFTIGSLGQHPNVLKTGDADYTYLYLIYGDKAARIKVYTVVTDPEEVDPEELQMVGETDVYLSAEINDAYGTKPLSFDMAPILEALGVDSYDEDVYSWASEGVISNHHTEGSGGFYWDDEGYIIEWSQSTTAFYAALGNIANGEYNIGQMAGHFTNITEDTTINADLIYKVDSKYYVVHIHYTVKAPEAKLDNPDDNFDIVSVIPLAMELVPSDKYYGDCNAETKANMQMELDMNAVAKLIGEGSYEFWGLKAPVNADSYGTLTTSTGYGTNSGFTGGFWMGMPNADLGEEYVNYAWVANWAQNSYGIEWNLSTGIIGFDIHPGSPTHQVGDTYKSIFYLENESTHKAIKYILTVSYVEAYSAKGEEVGREEITGILDENNLNDEDFYFVGEAITNDVYEALGIDESEYEDCQWMVMNSAGKFVVHQAGLQGETATFDENGFYVDLNAGGLEEDVAFTVTYDESAKRFAMGFFGQEDGPENLQSYIEGKTFHTSVALMFDGKYYVFDIFAGNEAAVTSINNIVGASIPSVKMYDISGREVVAPTRGLYIINGKKVMIK